MGVVVVVVDIVGDLVGGSEGFEFDCGCGEEN